MHPLFRFGLAPGSALILIAAIEVISPLMTLILDFGGALAAHNLEIVEWGFWQYFLTIIMLGLFFMTWVLLLYGVVLRGNKTAVLGWIGVSIAFISIYISLEIYFVNWSPEYLMYNLNALYLIIVTVIVFAYKAHFAIHCLPSFATTIVDLEPIGKGAVFIWDYYKGHTKEAVMLLLMFDIVLNACIILDRQISRFIFGQGFIGHEGDLDAAIIIEETFLRYVRTIWTCVGFGIAYKAKQIYMWRWCVCYLLLLAMSLGIFFYLCIMWRSEHVILTLTYLGLMVVSLIFRMALLCIAVRYTHVFERLGIPM